MLSSELNKDNMNYKTLRHVLRKSSNYRVRNIIRPVLKCVERMLPVIRELVMYLRRVMNKKHYSDYSEEIKKIASSEVMSYPLINMWISFFLQKAEMNQKTISFDYDNIMHVRDKVLIAKSRGDTVWIKRLKENVDTLGPWDKRAVLFASTILSKDEKGKWLRACSEAGDIVDKSICGYALNCLES